MPVKRTPDEAKSQRVFGQARKPTKMLRAGLYARVSTLDQQTLPMQMRALRDYASKRGWSIALQVKEVGSGAVERELRQELLDAARRREIDVVTGMAVGPMGPLVDGFSGDPSGTRRLGRSFHVSHGSTRSDHIHGARHGGNAIGLLRVRTRHTP